MVMATDIEIHLRIGEADGEFSSYGMRARDLDDNFADCLEHVLRAAEYSMLGADVSLCRCLWSITCMPDGNYPGCVAGELGSDELKSAASRLRVALHRFLSEYDRWRTGEQH